MERGSYSNEVPPSDPRPQLLHERLSRQPLPPPFFNHATLEQWSREQRGSEHKCTCDLADPKGPPAEQTQELGTGSADVLRQDIDGDEGAGAARERDNADARADDDGAVPVHGWRGSCERGEVEGENIGEGEGDLVRIMLGACLLCASNFGTSVLERDAFKYSF